MKVLIALAAAIVCSQSNGVFAQGNTGTGDTASSRSGAVSPSHSWSLSYDPYSHGDIKADPSIAESINDCKAADSDANRGAWADATALYQSALALCPTNPTALYGMAACRHATGDAGGEMTYYRAAIYTTAQPPYTPVVREMNAERLMKYVILLSQAGQAEEALAIYNRAAELMNYDHGKQRREVLLPEFGPNPGQSAYTPDALKAMAHLGVAVQAMGFDDRETLPHLQETLKLAPDSAAAQYYLGKHLLGRNNVAAKVALQKAVQLGDEQTAKAAQVYLTVLP